MIVVREAKGDDAQEISRVFKACYGDDYAYPAFYDLELLAKMIYTDDTVILVAEDDQTGDILGTASVVCQIGANSDLTGEFGRLAVDPAARNRGVGKLLMNERLERIRDRLEIGVMDARVVHPFTLKIAEKNGFNVVGFEPMKMLIAFRESIALCVQYFGQALSLRNNHPRIIPEVYPIAVTAMRNCGIEFDAVVDEHSPAYPDSSDFTIEEMKSNEGYSSLLRIQRGRVSNREIFGPVRLHYGLFKLRMKQSRYFIAREEGRIVGAVGFMVDEVEKFARIYELISLNDDAIKYLLQHVERTCREELGVEFVEVDVSAYAPRMQKTLLELNFLPVAYIPAMVFHEVERLDAIRMVRLNVPLDLKEIFLSESAQEIADIVLKGFRTHSVVPLVAKAMETMDLLDGCNKEQANRLAQLCSVEQAEKGKEIFTVGQSAIKMYVILEGVVSVQNPEDQSEIGEVRRGECLGEVAFLQSGPHSARAVAASDLKMAVLDSEDFKGLVRQRPDIGLILYRNLAIGLGDKLRRNVEAR